LPQSRRRRNSKALLSLLRCLRAVHAKRQEITDQADAGKITLDQANFELTQVTDAATKVIQKRNNQKALMMIPNLTILQAPSRPEMGMGMK
jgi:hypothetical protein